MKKGNRLLRCTSENLSQRLGCPSATTHTTLPHTIVIRNIDHHVRRYHHDILQAMSLQQFRNIVSIPLVSSTCPSWSRTFTFSSTTTIESDTHHMKRKDELISALRYASSIDDYHHVRFIK